MDLDRNRKKKKNKKSQILGFNGGNQLSRFYLLSFEITA